MLEKFASVCGTWNARHS